MNIYKTFTIAATFCLAFMLGSCGDDDNTPVVKPTTQGTFTDADGSVYSWVRIGELDWMTRSYHGGQTWYTQSGISENDFEFDLSTDNSEEVEDSLIKVRGNFITSWITTVPSMYHEGDYGYYWTSTIDTTKEKEVTYIRVITPVANKVERGTSTTKLNYLSVRYVRNAQ